MQMALPYLAVPSCEAVAQRRPSRVVQTCTTQPVCPSNTCAQFPLTISHTRAVKSSEAVRTRRPSGVSATDHTAPAIRDPPAAEATCDFGLPAKVKGSTAKNSSAACCTAFLALQKKRKRHTLGEKRSSWSTQNRELWQLLCELMQLCLSCPTCFEATDRFWADRRATYQRLQHQPHGL